MSQSDRIAANVEQSTADPLVADTESRDIIVESDAFRAVFANRGAELVSWQLKEYLSNGRPVELVLQSLPPEDDEPWPFTVAFEREDLTYLADQALFRPSRNRIRLGERTETLTFDYEDASGFSIQKTYSFDPSESPYVVRLTVKARLGDEVLQTAIQWGPGVGGVTVGGSVFAFQQGPRGVMYGRVSEPDGLLSVEPSLERPDRSDVSEQPTYDGLLDFVGVDNHYFAAVALPEKQQMTVNFRAVQLQPLAQDGEAVDLMAFELQAPNGVNNLAFFIGPKDFDILERASAPLIRAIDFGWLSVLVVPLHRTLKWAYGWVGNYGVAIILITLLVNIVIFPLRHKSVASMRKMQEIQPEMKAIQSRYEHLKATDPDKQKMNQEVMALYRDRGVNPVSGCLPMVLTMPILFAFYRLLSMAIELRGAPFMLWITDLSVHDPLYVTPIIMGVTMVVQQRLTPSQADPMQQKIMMFMPIMFTFMFLWAPSGLVIYWLTSNLLGIGQQLVTYRIIGPPKIRTVQQSSERRVKAKKI
jgi:YidC/Oxa1 family membrane protein insertase